MPTKRLLLIEDDYDVAEMLLMYFSSHEYEVLHADNGTDGIDLARTRFPNLILLDVMLPDMDGYDICLKLRGVSLTKYIPIVFLTQRDERASKVRGLELGADDYITKPFDIDELRLRVQGSIRRATREHLHEPRTGLPTGPLVDDELSRRQDSSKPYNELIFSLEGYKAYSDVYGFMAASEVFAHAAKTIQTLVSEKGTSDDFIGIVNDEFIVLTHTPDVPQLDDAVKKKFSDDVKAFYTFIDAERGGIMVNAGLENERLVPMMTLYSLHKVVASGQKTGDVTA
jgi:DNA-binding response OmpR family regulator